MIRSRAGHRHDPNVGGEPASTRGIKGQAVAAILWLGGGRLFTRFVDQLVVLVLARLLVPEDFGIVAMASVFARLLTLLTSMGVTRAVVQRPHVDDAYLSTALWGNMAIGCLLSGVGWGAAGLIAKFYHEPLVGPVFAALSLRFALTGATVVQSALISRQMRFGVLQVRNIISAGVAGSVAVVLALRGAGVWSLIAQIVVADLLDLVLLWTATAWRPKRLFSWTNLRELWGFGSRILGSQFFNYVVKYFDNLLIGRMLGAVQLGYYAFGYALFLTPLLDITGTVWQVTFSAFSRLQEDLPRLRRGFLLTTKYVALITFPVLLGLLLVARDLITVVFGAKWLPAAPVLQILLVAGVLRSQVSIWNSVLPALGRVNWMFRWAVASAAIYVPAFLIGIRWGIVGVAAGYTVSALVVAPFQLAQVRRLVGFQMQEYLTQLAPVLLATGFMTVCVLLAQTLLRQHSAGAALRLGVAVAVGALAFTSFILRMQPDLAAEVRQTVGTLRIPLRPHLAGDRA